MISLLVQILDHNSCSNKCVEFSSWTVSSSTVRKLFLRETGLPADSGTYEVCVLNSHCGDSNLFKIHTPLSLFLAFLINLNSRLSKGFCERTRLNAQWQFLACQGWCFAWLLQPKGFWSSGFGVTGFWLASVRFVVARSVDYISLGEIHNLQVIWGIGDREISTNIVWSLMYSRHSPLFRVS